MNGYGGGNAPLKLDTPPNLTETIRFASEKIGKDGVPFSMHIATTADWRLPRARITEVAFTREDPPGSSEWLSTLSAGKGRFLEIGREFALREGDFLQLQGLDRAQIDIVRQDAFFRILLQGTVDRLEAGPEGLVNDLTPNLLEWLVNAKEVALSWTALLFLWGLAWKLRSFWNGAKTT